MALDQSVRPEIAMVSRIRVEVRGESLKAAEQVAFEMLDHARLAGVLEGFMPSGGSYADPHFSQPGLTRKFEEGPEPWNELGLPYYGRLSFVFEPMSGYGGLKQFGFNVERDEDVVAYPGMTDHGFIVLDRKRPVQRVHAWEMTPLRDSPGETGESILIDIRSIKDVKHAVAKLDEQGVRVDVEMDGWENVVGYGPTLHEAAATARREIVEMLEQAASVVEQDVEAPFAVSMHIANLNVPTAQEAVAHKEYRTLIVGTITALGMATEVARYLRTGDGYAIAVLLDTEHDGDSWTLTTEEPTEVEKRIR